MTRLSTGFSSAETTLVELLRQRAVHQPDELAYTFLLDGEADEATLTYHELDLAARAIAARLQELGAGGQRVLLLYQPGLEYVAGFLGCLYAGATAVPSYPPDPFRMERTFPRFQAIVNNCRPLAVLTSAMIGELAGELFQEHPDFQGIELITTDDLPVELADSWRDPDVEADTLAFLQYTSGSTATPKGVMLTHGNLIANLALIYDGFAITPSDTGLIWLPPYHDMGLIGGILQPLYAGFPVILMSPLDFLQRPLRWLKAITRYRTTVSGGPNFAYDLCVRKITPEQRADLDLSSWRVAFNGAEPVRRETIDRFSQAFAPCGFRHEAFYPCYGLAEATLIASGGRADASPVVLTLSTSALAAHRVALVPEGEQEGQSFVGCGQTLGAQQIVIADPKTGQQLPDGQVGEIWVAGASVAQGYWDLCQETEATFGAHLAGSNEGPFLRTGDMGFLRQGELFVTGRIKDLIIIDGRNHYPQDIELTVEKSHAALRPGCSAAFPVDAGEGEKLVVVAEVGKGYQPRPGGNNYLDAAEVMAAIRRAVNAEHELRIHDLWLLRPGIIPKTSSGKIQRHACREGYATGALERWVY